MTNSNQQLKTSNMTACTHDINGRRIHKQEGTDATKVFTSKRQLQVSC